MAILSSHLELARCPHCQIDNPNLSAIISEFTTAKHDRTGARTWAVYNCSRCGGAVLAGGYLQRGVVEAREIYPVPIAVDNSIPEIAKAYLSQAINSLHAPAGAVMLCASAIDAMLKVKGYTSGNLYGRINKASEDHLITDGMKEWAHEIRLDANDQRHADQEASLPTTADAQRSIEFAQALGQFLFVLPARVAQGRAAAQPNSTSVSTPRTSPGVTQADVAR
jgi:hypothetical protein